MDNEIAADRQSFDQRAGRILYGICGVVAAIPALGGLIMGTGAIAAGQYSGGTLCLVFSAGMGALARWCFSPSRRLSEAEWWI